MRTTAHISPGIKAFSGQIQAAAASATLDLLRAVDETVDALTRIQRMLRYDIDMANWLVDAVLVDKERKEIDPEDMLDNLLEKGENSIREAIEGMKIRRRAATEDAELKGFHEDSVVSEYDNTIEQLTDLFNAIEQLRIVVREHDADLSHDVGPFTSADELIAALNTDA